MRMATTIASVTRLRFTWPMPPEMSQTTTNTAAMPRTVSRIFGTRGWWSFGSGGALRSAIRAWGTASKAMKRKIVGMANDVVAKRPDQSRKLVWNVTASPRRIAPRKVRGRLRSRPTIAAANALMISRVSASTWSPSSDTSRIPDTAAIAEPIAHDSIDAASGRAPWRPARLRLSTTARIVTPMRVR